MIRLMYMKLMLKESKVIKLVLLNVNSNSPTVTPNSLLRMVRRCLTLVPSILMANSLRLVSLITVVISVFVFALINNYKNMNKMVKSMVEVSSSPVYPLNAFLASVSLTLLLNSVVVMLNKDIWN